MQKAKRLFALAAAMLLLLAAFILPIAADGEDAPDEAVIDLTDPDAAQEYVQLDLFSPPEQREREDRAMERENRLMKAVLSIKNRYGKNAILRGMNFEKGATTRERNGQVGGHKA